MTIKILGLVAVRLLALYFFITGIGSIFSTLWYLAHLIDGPSIPILDKTYGSLLFAGGMYIVLGIIIWRYAYLISDRLVPEELGGEKISGLVNVEELYAIAIAVVGFLILESSIRPLSSAIVFFADKGFSKDIGQNALASVLYILLAGSLIYYSIRIRKQ